jgi:RimJ/RimL family protein N-acetyltransferase
MLMLLTQALEKNITKLLGIKLENYYQQSTQKFSEKEQQKIEKKSLVKSKINNGESFILRKDNLEIGWMRYGYFWDNTPFMNMIWIVEEYRGRGYGTEVVD